MRFSTSILALSIAFMWSSEALAQASAEDDVVVMRRVIAPPQLKAPGDSDTDPDEGNGEGGALDGRWIEGEWAFQSAAPQCTSSAIQTNVPVCVSQDGLTTLDNARCDPEDKPETERQVERLDGCTYEYDLGEWSNYNSQCSKTAARTRSVSCVRSDSTPAAIQLCHDNVEGEIPKASETAYVDTGCDFKWRPKTNAINIFLPFCTNGSTILSEANDCVRSSTGQIVTDSNCISGANVPGPLQTSIAGGVANVNRLNVSCQATGDYTVSSTGVAGGTNSSLLGEPKNLASGSFIVEPGETVAVKGPAICLAASKSIGSNDVGANCLWAPIQFISVAGGTRTQYAWAIRQSQRGNLNNKCALPVPARQDGWTPMIASLGTVNEAPCNVAGRVMHVPVRFSGASQSPVCRTSNPKFWFEEGMSSSQTINSWTCD